MKKILTITAIVLILCASIFCFSACTNRNSKITVYPCWANNEILTYNIYDTENSVSAVGTLSVTLEASDDVNKMLMFGSEERTYGSANVRIRESLLRNGVCDIETTILSSDYTVLAVQKVYNDLNKDDGDESYVLQSYHDGKNYVYTISYNDGREDKSGKINVGSSNYTDNEFLYYYIRCYEIGSVPSKTKVADPFTDKAYEISCSNDSSTTVRCDCKDTRIGSDVLCNKVTIKLTSTPTGTPIQVYYATDIEDYELGDYGLSSRKFPVKIVENNISYVLRNAQAFSRKPEAQE